MRARLGFVTDELRNSYWFVPAVMTAGAVVLSILTLWVDGRLTSGNQPGWLRVILYSGGADGAREVLSAIAGSMITVAGVVFSITIVALTLASNQFGPRLLSNFMSDRGNQITLGTFISAFLYSLLILRKTRTGETEQVPHLSVAVALMLAVAGISVLIYFIHHVASQIQAPNLVASIGADLEGYVDRIFPHAEGLEHGRAAHREVPLPDGFEGDARGVDASSSGYVEFVDLDDLLALAEDRDLVVRLQVRPGRFVVRGTTLAEVWPPDLVDDTVRARIARSMVTGSRRTPAQDFEFPVQQLAEIAVRSLSPGINDPYTANSCIQWLSSVLSKLSDHAFSSSQLVDHEGALRVVVAAPVQFDELVGEAFDGIRQSADFHTSVYVALLRALTDIASRARTPPRFEPLLAQGRLVLEAAERGVKQSADLDVVRRKHDELVAVAVRGGAGV